MSRNSVKKKKKQELERVRGKCVRTWDEEYMRKNVKQIFLLEYSVRKIEIRTSFIRRESYGGFQKNC